MEGEGMEWTLPDGLPPGRLIVPDPEFAEEEPVTEPVLWVSSDPVPDAGPLWARLLALHPDSGLWPLLLMGRPVSPRRAQRFPEKARWEVGRPWHSGELAPVPAERIDSLDAGRLLAEWWDATIGPRQKRIRPGTDAPAQPFRAWPGLAEPSAPGRDPDQHAVSVVTAPGGIRRLTMYDGDPYVGLTRALDGAAAITACGWLSRADGAAGTAAVVRSWQERFGGRLCSLSMDTLGMAVAWPPTTLEHARRVAAEHLAFCPDLLDTSTLDDHARSLVGAPLWACWWD
jgi:hypothetical protein